MARLILSSACGNTSLYIYIVYETVQISILFTAHCFARVIHILLYNCNCVYVYTYCLIQKHTHIILYTYFILWLLYSLRMCIQRLSSLYTGALLLISTFILCSYALRCVGTGKQTRSHTREKQSIHASTIILLLLLSWYDLTCILLRRRNTLRIAWRLYIYIYICV